MSSVRIGAKMAFFRGFGPRRAAVWAEQPFFSFAIIFYHPKEHSLRVSALYSKIFLNYTFGLDILRSARGPSAAAMQARGPSTAARQATQNLEPKRVQDKNFELKAETRRECSLGW